MKRLLTVWLLLFSAAWGYSQTVTIAAAANLTALEAPLKDAFARAHPGMKAQFVFGSSGELVTQILHNAPYQAFLSADLGFAQKLVDAKQAVGPVKTYAVGKLVFLAVKPADLSKGLNVLLDGDVAQFAIANPDTAPYGRAAVEALTKSGLYDKVKAKQITAQSIAQAVQFTLTAGFGFVNKSALLSPEVTKLGPSWFEVDPSLYSPLEQGFVVLTAAASDPAAQAFADFLFSPDAQQVFDTFGYGRP